MGENRTVKRWGTADLALLLGLVLAMLPAGAFPRKHTLLNKPAPTFTRSSLDNQPVDLASLRGRVVLLNFWATWCTACEAEIPRFVEWQEKYGGEGLSIVGVAMDDDAAPVKAFLNLRRVNYPILMGDEKLGLEYGGVLGLPVTYLIDRKGIIRARFEGGTSLDSMESVVRRCLRKP
jgi:cytochrome c biogenesis protein CcmG/thiol:disulfide interchange protein DsbE